MKPLLRTFITIFMGLAASVWTQAGYANGTISFKAPGELPIVTYTQRHDRVTGVDRSAELMIFADGRVIVHRPGYMTVPGNWEYQLSGKQILALLQQFHANGLIEFDAAKVSAQRNAARQVARDSGLRHAIGDSTYSIIALRLANFSIDGSGSRAVDQHISWVDIGEDARRFRGVAGLQGLAAAEKSLVQLLNPSLRNARQLKGDQ